jgi:hypothetical protein
MARCTLETGSGEAVFEVRRTELQRAANGLCQGVALAALEITLNGITIAKWPHDYDQCVTLDYNPPRLARSVSFDSERVEVCAPVRLEGDRWLDRRDLTIQCRAEPLAAVLSAGAFPD